MTYHENTTFSMFKCLSTFFVSLSVQAFSASLQATQILLPPWHIKGTISYYYRPLNCKFPLMAPPLCDGKRQWCASSNAMANIWAKHDNCSVFGCNEHRTLFRVPATEETKKQWIYWFIYCILHHTDLIQTCGLFPSCLPSYNCFCNAYAF